MGYKYGFRSNNLSTDNIFGFRQIFKYIEKMDAVFQLFLGFKRAQDSVMRDVLHNSFIECVINMKLATLQKCDRTKTISESG